MPFRVNQSYNFVISNSLQNTLTHMSGPTLSLSLTLFPFFPLPFSHLTSSPLVSLLLLDSPKHMPTLGPFFCSLCLGCSSGCWHSLPSHFTQISSQKSIPQKKICFPSPTNACLPDHSLSPCPGILSFWALILHPLNLISGSFLLECEF